MNAVSSHPSSPIPFSPFILSFRQKELSERVQRIAGKIYPEGSFQTVVGSFSVGANTYVEKNIRKVELPMHFLLKYEDIPLEFRITGVDDPRFWDLQFLTRFTEWLNSIHQQLKLPDLGVFKDCVHVHEFLISLRDRQLYETSKDFTIGHEIGHHLPENKTFFKKLMHYGIIGAVWVSDSTSLTICVALSVLPISIIVVVGNVPVVVVALAVTMLALGLILVGCYALSAYGSSKLKEVEKKCDLSAAKGLNNVEAGIYHHQTYILVRKKLREKSLKFASIIDEKGNYLQPGFTHPSSAERVAYLRQWQNQQTPSRVSPARNFAVL